MPSGQPVEIVKVIRRMRDVAQSFLIKGSDGNCYFAKFLGHPRGNRTLINESIAGHLLRCLGVSTPDHTMLRLDARCEGQEQLYFLTDGLPIAAGLHLGLRCPVDPERVAMFDFLPRRLFPRVVNLDELGVLFAFDQWVAHSDSRQTIFAPQRDASKCADQPHEPRFTCWAIDNGKCFGKDWMLKPQTLYACYRDLHAYSHFAFHDSAHHGAHLIESLPESELVTAYQAVPPEWFSRGDDVALNGMFNALQDRRIGLRNCIPEHLRAMESMRS